MNRSNGICPAAAVTVIAAALAEGRSSAEIDLLAALFVQLGDTLATISAAKAMECECTNAPSVI